MALHIADGFDLPDDGVTQTFGFIARKGAGKTYAAGKLVEELVRLGAPVIVIDPIGNWYGLRLAADGRSPGLPIPVFGGMNGDVPIGEGQGEQLAELIVSKNLSAVVDVSGFRKAQRKRFVADFIERLFHEAKRSREARVIVFEEAQVFAPQRAAGGEERMLGAVEDVVRLGRNFGLGSVLISQRPQSVNKEVLNQVEALFVGQLSGPQERKAIDQWVSDRRGERKLLDQLPTLPVGTMVLWSPQWLGVLKKVKIGKKSTFDASATPVLGAKKLRGQTLAEVDVAGLRAALEDVVEPAAAAPTKGKGKGTSSPAAAPTTKPEAQTNDTRAQVLETEISVLRETMHHQRGVFQGTLLRYRAKLAELDREIGEMLERLDAEHSKAASKPRLSLVQAQPSKPTNAKVLPKPTPAEPPDGAPDLHKKGVRRMLTALATFYPGTMTKAQIARAGKIKITGGTFSAYWSRLLRYKLIEDVGDGFYRITDAGLASAGVERPEVPPDLEGRVAFWNARLREGERRMLAEVLEAGSRGCSRADLAARAEITQSGGTFSAYLSTLATNRLVLRRGDVILPHPWLLTGSG